MLSVLLNEWQYHEELWLEGNSDAGARVAEILLALREVFTLFGSMLPRKASGSLRESLLTLSQEMATTPAEELCFSARWSETQLALTHWLTEQPWKSVLEEKHRKKLQGSFKRFCDVMLGRVFAELKATTAEFNQPTEYQDKSQRIHKQLLAVCLLCGAYPWQRWIAGWNPGGWYFSKFIRGAIRICRGRFVRCTVRHRSGLTVAKRTKPANN